MTETEKGRTKMAAFLREAFCIDGEAAFKKNVTLDGLFGETYELSDSKRGVFYISIHSEKTAALC